MKLRLGVVLGSCYTHPQHVGTQKMAANLLIKMKEEFDYLENELGLRPISAC